MRTLRPFVLGLVFAAGAAACSSSSSSGSSGPNTTPCNENPWECPSGQTCWPQNASTFACMNAGPGTLGSPCQDVVASPTCGVGLACFQSTATGGGTCVAYCSTTDTIHACSGGAICETAVLGGTGGPEFNVCVTPQAPSDAGSDSSPAETGAGDTGASDAPAEASSD